MPPDLHLTYGQVRALCGEGRQITSGPLNDTYQVTLNEEVLFVRHRTLAAYSYGQTFAGERYVSRHLEPLGVRVPNVRCVVLDGEGAERYAVFDFIDGIEPDWGDVRLLESMAECLAAVHQVRGTSLRDINSSGGDESVVRFLTSALTRELMLQDDAELQAFSSPLGDLIERDFASERICLCHGDVHRSNWMVDAEGQLRLVDWEAARFRVAATDFNQLSFRWLSRSQVDYVLTRYAESTGRDRGLLERQILLLRALWHVRTFNFNVVVRRQPPVQHDIHLLRAKLLLTEVTGQKRILMATAVR